MCRSANDCSPGVQAVIAAIKKLPSLVKGFWVEMLLDWGGSQAAMPKAPVSPAMIARADVPTNGEKVSA